MRKWYLTVSVEGTHKCYNIKASSKIDAIKNGMEKARSNNPNAIFVSCVMRQEF